jgi:hypothetical protein
MDSNPMLYARLKKHVKMRGLRDIQFKQAKSHSDNLLQLVDYVVGICSKKAKNAQKSAELYRTIAKHELDYSSIRDKTKKP